jgi:hypothetical protein
MQCTALLCLVGDELCDVWNNRIEKQNWNSRTSTKMLQIYCILCMQTSIKSCYKLNLFQDNLGAELELLFNFMVVGVLTLISELPMSEVYVNQCLY